MSVDVTQKDAVRIITINRPEVANAYDPATISALGAALTDADEDADVGAVVLTGAGDRAFCAGMDLKAFAEGRTIGGDDPALDVIYRRAQSKPTIAAVNGAAVAGGLELLLTCDLAVAAEHARFGLPEVKRGLVAAGGGTRLPRRLPLAVALELGLTGELIDAPRAFALGLVNRVVPGASLMGEARALAGTICENGPLAVRVTKQLMYEEVGPPIDWERVGALTTPVFESDDASEGARAFAEKRPPRWTGR